MGRHVWICILNEQDSLCKQQKPDSSKVQASMAGTSSFGMSGVNSHLLLLPTTASSSERPEAGVCPLFAINSSLLTTSQIASSCLIMYSVSAFETFYNALHDLVLA